MKKIFFLTTVMVIMLGFNLSQVSAQSMGPGMMGPGYGQDQQRGDWNYCPYCGNSLGPGYGYGMGYGMMGGYGMGPYMMGRGYYGMGPGMMYRGYGMGPGMMGYGYGYGPQYGRQQGPVDEKDAKKMMEDYLKSIGNPNLKLGKIEDKGDFFEAEIQTKDGETVNTITINKQTGWMGPYMMGRGYYGMGPGMMYRGYGMGPGMMGYGYGMGYGMMGRGYGMGPGYGYPNAPGYQGPQYQQPAEPLKKKDAEKLLNNYLQSTRNPNLKLGKIEDKGDSFEAEIETKNGDLVDKIIVDKKTGGMHSAY